MFQLIYFYRPDLSLLSFLFALYDTLNNFWIHARCYPYKKNIILLLYSRLERKQHNCSILTEFMVSLSIKCQYWMTKQHFVSNYQLQRNRLTLWKIPDIKKTIQTAYYFSQGLHDCTLLSPELASFITWVLHLFLHSCTLYTYLHTCILTSFFPVWKIFKWRMPY